MRDWLKALGLLALLFLGIVVFAELGNHADQSFEKSDPVAYERYLEEVRAEGVPDPRR